MTISLLVGVIRGNYPGATYDKESNPYGLKNYSSVANPESIYNPEIDGETKYSNGTNSLLRRDIVGSSWSHSINCGSRSTSGNLFGTPAFGHASIRGRKENRNILGRL